jgi:hypothetical protein
MGLKVQCLPRFSECWVQSLAAHTHTHTKLGCNHCGKYWCRDCPGNTFRLLVIPYHSCSTCSWSPWPLCPKEKVTITSTMSPSAPWGSLSWCLQERSTHNMGEPFCPLSLFASCLAYLAESPKPRTVAREYKRWLSSPSHHSLSQGVTGTPSIPCGVISYFHTHTLTPPARVSRSPISQ